MDEAQPCIGPEARADERASAIRPRANLSQERATVLFLGKSDATADLLGVALFSHGLVMVRATSLSEAFDAIQAARPACIVCALSEDDGVGLDAVGVVAAHRATRSLPILALSNDDELRVAALECGATVAMAARFSADAIAPQVAALVRTATRLATASDDVFVNGRPAISGTILGSSIDAVLTIIALERRTGVFEVFGAATARVDVVEGYAITAELGGAPATPLDALLGVFANAVSFSFSALPLVAPTDGASRLDALLLNLARTLDEQRATDPMDLAESA